jgi:hypothetical protein
MLPDTRRQKLASRFSDPDFDVAGDEPAPSAGNLFIWTIIILLLVGFAIACWIGSFYIFEHPETPLSYKVLNKLHKLDPPKRFELTAAPRGEFLKPAQILERYQKMAPRELMHVNEALLRNYLRNYKLTQDLVPYVVGTFNILDSYELGKDDFWGAGVVALAQAKDSPKLLLEQVFPAQAKVVPALQRTLLTGLDIDLRRENELAAILHVEKLDDGRLKVTALPILYPSYGSTAASGTFSLDPPDLLNVAAGLPVVTAKRQAEADAKYVAFRRRAGLTDNSPNAPLQSRLMRVERPVAVNPPALPENPPVLPAIPVNTPAMAPPAAPALPTPSPAIESAPPDPAQSPAMIPDSSTGSWPVYAPGQMPRGRLLSVKDISDSGGARVGGDRVYLQGNFVVTGSGPEGAVLRTQGAITDAIGLGGRSDKVRVIVKFPPGMRPPAKDATFSRDSRRPFQITEVSDSADGQINVYVREVTRP